MRKASDYEKVRSAGANSWIVSSVDMALRKTVQTQLGHANASITLGWYAHALLRLYAITDRNDDIEVIVINLIGFTIIGSCCIFCNNCQCLKLTLGEHILNMT